MSSAAIRSTSQASSSPPALAVGRLAAAGGEHGDDQRVEGAEGVVQLVGRGAQRRGEDRYADRLAGRVDRVGQGVREGGVPAGLVGPVEEHPDPRQVGSADASAASSHPPRRDLGRRLEALAGEQHGVGEERVQLGEVRRAALGQVAVRLGGDADRHRWTAPSARRSAAARRRARPSACRSPRIRSKPGHRSCGEPRIRPTTRSQPVDHLGHRLVRRTGPGWPRRSRHPRRGRRAGRCRTWTAARCVHGSSSGFSPLVGRRSRGQCLAGPVASTSGRHSGGTAPDSHRVPVPRDVAAQPSPARSYADPGQSVVLHRAAARPGAPRDPLAQPRGRRRRTRRRRAGR